MKNVMITGGGQGIGREIALTFARRGHNIIVLDLDRDTSRATAKLVEQTGTQGIAIFTDVTDRASVEDAFAEAENTIGAIDVLVNNAGIIAVMPFEELTEDTWSRILNVNVNGVFHASQAFVRRALAGQRGGAIVNLSSVSAKIAFNGSSAYNVSKSAVEGLTRCLAVEFGQHGIRCNAVAPGIIETEMTKPALSDDALRSEWHQRIPQRKFGTVENVANAVAFLASDEAAYINGETVVIDGGALANWSKPDDQHRFLSRSKS